MTEERFDAELRRAARSLAAEPMPNGMLGRGLLPPERPAQPSFAAVAAALAVLVIAIAVTSLPGSVGGPVATATASVAPTPRPPTFRSTPEIRADFVRLGYACISGGPVPSIGPGPDVVVRQSVICNAPADIGSLMAAVIVGEAADGRVVEAHAKADIVGQDTSTARDAIATVLAKDAAVVVVAGQGNPVSDWVRATLPGLEPGADATASIGGVGLRLSRNVRGGYELEMGGTAGT